MLIIMTVCPADSAGMYVGRADAEARKRPVHINWINIYFTYVISHAVSKGVFLNALRINR